MAGKNTAEKTTRASKSAKTPNTTGKKPGRTKATTSSSAAKKVTTVSKQADANSPDTKVTKIEAAVVQPPKVETPPTPPVPTTPPIETPKQVLLLNGRVTTLVPPVKDKHGWSEARRRYTVNYLAKLQSLIRLNDWEITVDFTPVNDDMDFESFAEITPALSARRATLRFGRKFFSIPSNEQRQTLLHELIHLHLAAIHEMASDTVTALSDEKGFAAFNGAYDVAMEITTDGLADAFAPLLEPFELPGR